MRVFLRSDVISNLSPLTVVRPSERPIRSFEVLADVCNSWVADKTVNILMAKKTLLAPKLSRAVSLEQSATGNITDDPLQAIPSSSPICGGFVQHEYKRGKWQKRWLELREHSLWLSKRDTVRHSFIRCIFLLMLLRCF